MEKRVVNKITVVGGGTAGWLSALYLKQVYPDKHIEVIESEAIGILGAGEGTTPQFVHLLDFLNIPVSSLVESVGATIKNGIRFTNWRNDGGFYYHPFPGFDDFSPTVTDPNSYMSNVPTVFAAANLENPLQIGGFVAKASEKNRVTLERSPQAPTNPSDPIFKYNQFSLFALHFDAAQLAVFLREIAEFRGITRTEGIVADITENSFGDVDSLILESGDKVTTEFIIDATGFKRYFQKKLKGTWVSHSDYLPVNAAMPFFLPMPADKDIPPYTDSVAMKYGWMWKIPLQHRYGCGYIYDSSLITVEEAKKEIEDYLGYVPEYPRETPFSFNAGYYSTPWIKNVVSVGLAGGFIEPLEATSIWMTILSIKNLVENPAGIYNRDPKQVDFYNKRFVIENAQNVDFLYLHYMTQRTDTEFWKRFTADNAPEGLKHYLEILSHKMLSYTDTQSSIWNTHSWYWVGLGTQNPLFIDSIKTFNSSFSQSFHYKQVYEEASTFYNKTVASATVGHREFLNDLKQGV